MDLKLSSLNVSVTDNKHFPFAVYVDPVAQRLALAAGGGRGLCLEAENS